MFIKQDFRVAWPSGLRRWFKAPVSSGAWVRIPPLPDILPINFVQVPNSSTYFIEKWPFLEGSCQNFWHWEGKYAGCWGCGGEMYEQWKKFQGTHGFEPWTYRTAADCSTTELYPQLNSLPRITVHPESICYWQQPWDSQRHLAPISYIYRMCPLNAKSGHQRRRWYNGQHSCLPSSWSGFDSRPTQTFLPTHSFVFCTANLAVG